MVEKKPSQTALYGELLTNDQQYHADFAQVKELTREEEQCLLQRVRSGDTLAREEFILSGFAEYVRFCAQRCMRVFAGESSRIEYLDLVQVGHLAIIEILDEAIQKDNPFSYVRVVIRHSMYRYCFRYVTPISTPQREKFYRVKSLDTSSYGDEGKTLGEYLAETLQTPLPPQNNDDDSSPEHDQTLQKVFRAVCVLGKKQKEVIERLYGLSGFQPHTWQQINEAMGCPDAMIWQHKDRALTILRHILSERGNEEVYTIQQACDVLGLSYSQFCNLVQRKGIKSCVRGYYRKSEIDGLVQLKTA